MNYKGSDISIIISTCKNKNRAGQKKLYELFFNYGMGIALRYAKDRSEAQAILNDSFFKVFDKIHQYDQSCEFKPWFRKILVNTALDYQRQSKRWDRKLGIIQRAEQNYNQGWEHLNYEDVLKHIQLLPPAYRLVFNLFAIEGLKHQEIADKLDISVGSSKSNYAKARKKLQTSLAKAGLGKNFSYGK